MSNKTNKFRRAIHHLKSDQIDDRMSVLEAAPTNSTQNLMTVEPSVQVASTEETVSLGLDFDKGNEDDDGKDTSGIIAADGTILTLEPDVGDTSYILGPMASMWYAWGNFTRIGYIQQDTRKMVNLGSITGQLGSWDDEETFTSYGQLTFEQAIWFRDIGKKDGAGNDTPNYRAFYPGPPSSTADGFGRYLACIVGEGKTETTGNPRSTSDPKNAPEDATTQFSMLAFWSGKGKKDAIDKLRYDPNHPEGTNQPNPFEPGTTLYRNFEKQRAYDEHGLLGSAPSDDVKIAGAGGSPGQPYTPPKEDPNNPYVPAPGRKLAQFPTDPTSDATTSLGVQDGDKIAMATQSSRFDSILSNINKGKKLSTREVDYLRDNGLDDFYQGGMKSTDPVGELITLGVAAGAAKAIVVGLSKAFVSQSTKVLNGIVKNADKISKSTGGNAEVAQLFNLGKNKAIDTSIPGVRNAVDILVRAAKGGAKPNILKDIAVAKQGPGNQKALDLVIKAIKKVDPKTGWIMNSYKPQGKLLSEERIWLREIKKPVKVPELQKKFKGIKPKVKKKGDYKIVGGGLMKDNIAPPEFSPTRENRLWRKYEVNQNRRASQEKKNQVLELIGEGDHQWNHMLGNERWRSASQMKKFYGDHDYLYDYYYGGKKHKVLRKEGLEKDFLVFIEDENGFKDTILQSKLNELLAEERDKEDFKEYYMKETEQKEREKNFDRATKLKSIVGRIKRGDIKPEYPNEPPPKMVNGYHPKFGKKYKHDKLDPVSARSMPRTGDPEIDANVEKAKRKPK